MSSKNIERKIKYYCIYSRGDSAPAAFLAIFSHLFELVTKNYDGAIAFAESQHAHDARVSLRRMRTALAFFARACPYEHRGELDELLKSACRHFGRMRDLQARLEIVDRLFGADASIADAYRRECRKHIARGLPALQQYLDGSERAHLAEQIESIIDLFSGACSGDKEASVECYAAGKMQKALSSLPASMFKDIIKKKPQAIHKIRKKIRKLRYKAEIASPVLGSEMQELEWMLKSAADDLGFIHDIDMSFEAERDAALVLGDKLSVQLARDRVKLIKHLNRSLTKLEGLVTAAGMRKRLNSFAQRG